MSTKKAVAKTENKPLVSASDVPDFMKEDAGKGLEGLDQSDYVLPIVKLMQATDEQVQTGLAAGGDFFHVMAGRKLDKELRFVPIRIRKRYILFRPQESSGGSGSNVLARADDGIHWSPPNASFPVKLKNGKEVVWHTKPTVGASRLADWGTSDPSDPKSNPAATLIYDVVALLLDYPDLSPAVLSLKSTGVKAAKQLSSTINMSRAPAFGMMFTAFGSLEKNGSNSYWAYNIKGDGFVKDQELYEQAKNMHAVFASQDFTYAEADKPEEVPPAAENSKY